MYEVKVLGNFSSGHHLRDYAGRCEEPHGHNWHVEVICQSEVLNDLGLVIDFKVLKKKMNLILDSLDHVNINELEYFKTVNPSSENMAFYIFNKLREDGDISSNVIVKRVNVWETTSSCASYYE